MRRGKVIAGCAIGLLLVPMTGCEPLAGLAGGIGGTPAAGSLLQLMIRAEQKVLADYPLAVLIEVVGGPSAGVAHEAEDVDTWQFRFVDDFYGTFPGTVTLDYADQALAEPVHVPWPLLGTVFEDLPREMDLDDAVQLMRDAGYDEPFSAVTLRKPLTNPLPSEAYFVFTLPGKYVLVGALTGQVSEESH